MQDKICLCFEMLDFRSMETSRATNKNRFRRNFLERKNKMTENLKFIVQAVNKCLETEFNLISFDSQSDESLLQVLLDVFHKFDIINAKVRKSSNNFPFLTVLMAST